MCAWREGGVYSSALCAHADDVVLLPRTACTCTSWETRRLASPKKTCKWGVSGCACVLACVPVLYTPMYRTSTSLAITCCQ